MRALCHMYCVPCFFSINSNEDINVLLQFKGCLISKCGLENMLLPTAKFICIDSFNIKTMTKTLRTKKV